MADDPFERYEFKGIPPPAPSNEDLAEAIRLSRNEDLAERMHLSLTKSEPLEKLNRRRLFETIRDDFKLNPIVLLDKAGRSAPTVEKFEEHAQTCSFAELVFNANPALTGSRGILVV